MIIAITSSLPTFKAVRFHSGLNVLLADSIPGATSKQTRNSAGKTSLLEIIHFLMGSKCEKDSIFRYSALIKHTFSGEFIIDGEHFTVQRGGDEPSKIFLLAGGENRQHFPRKIDKTSERMFISNVNWQIFLGHAMFGMPADVAGTAFDKSGSPSFRALFSYFARRRNSGAFLNPERQSDKQQRGDWQVNLSYLLGLDWAVPFEFQKVRDRERTLEELKKAAKIGAFGQIVGTVAELRPQVAIAEDKAESLRQQLKAFEVLDSYKNLSRRAAKNKTDMQALGRESVGLYENLQHLERAKELELPPNSVDLEKMYASSGIELPGVALRRFEDVSDFYQSVIKNRATHLSQSIVETTLRIQSIDRRLEALNHERSEILRTLDGRGALEDFIDLQKDLATLEANAATLREQFKAAEILEGETTQLEIDRVNLKRRLQADHQQRKSILDKAILLIAKTIRDLYDDRTGRFEIGATENGPEFRISIEGDRGGGDVPPHSVAARFRVRG